MRSWTLEPAAVAMLHGTAWLVDVGRGGRGVSPWTRGGVDADRGHAGQDVWGGPEVGWESVACGGRALEMGGPGAPFAGRSFPLEVTRAVGRRGRGVRRARACV